MMASEEDDSASERQHNRGKRFSSNAELREAVRAECLQRIARWAGPDAWDDAQLEHLRSDLGAQENDNDLVFDRARAIYSNTRAALAELLAFVATMPERRDGCMQSLARVAAEVALPALSNADHLAAVYSAMETTELPLRRLLVLAYDKPGHWWWFDRRPERGELAVLSILAGNWPDLKRMLQNSGEITAAEVIEAEGSNIAKVREP